ncbi:MAG: energy transducer TonB [Thermodesulfovibrionales bacterium]
MNLERFVIVSLLVHLVVFLVTALIPEKPAAPVRDKPIIARLITPETPLQVKRPPAPPNKTRETTRERESRPLPQKRLPKDMQPPKMMEDKVLGPESTEPSDSRGLPSRGGRGAEPRGEKRDGSIGIKGPADSVNPFKEDLKLAEKRAVEKVTRESAEKGTDAEGKNQDETEGSPITFSTKDYKYYGYKSRLREKIESIWVYPREALQRGLYGDLVIEFTILKDGKLGAVRLLRTSGYKLLDDAAIKALRDGAPYWPLPEEWSEESFTITGHFIYSLSGSYIR